jgi:hypothetical protein
MLVNGIRTRPLECLSSGPARVLTAYIHVARALETVRPDDANLY